ncbi:hypothetical protein M0804_004887 [Polistes exclamans]|nr:hypothetical protein M0804_004887 [Polistes exclamans]
MLCIRPISGKAHFERNPEDLFVADKALGMDSDGNSVLGNRFIALRHINQSQMLHRTYKPTRATGLPLLR